ncbi:tubulin epsilon and delta complex protein 1 [Sphaeramia orbicularis]|uniref:tubulin epsilon and delta complex protein 1 n=1 Tax=Sphaeramia orbicularis TaxID=375764 RepID=UPI00117E3DF5|nr:tubulin epsilon and delta complex protein 1 [Sphaeramia orbicularis]
MQRKKASVSVEVKTVIGALCKVLAAAGLDSVPTPETFRRAKFGGGSDVEEHFWQLLSKILHKTSTVSFEAIAASETWKLVAAGLWQAGYYADWMYEMDKAREGAEKSFSSRDLLVALGWLLATGAMEKLLSQRVQQLDKTLLTPAPAQLVSPQLSDNLQLDSASMRRLQWLIGRLRHQGRTLLSMQEERARLLHTVLSVSLPSSVPSSCTDQSSMLVREDCARMQELCNLLEAYLNWKQVENIFWTWMDSVVDCHLTDLIVNKPTQVPERTSEICHHGNRGLEKLDDMLQRFPTAQKRQSKHRADVEDRGHGSEKGRGTLDTLLSSPPYVPSFVHVYRARLQDKRPVRSGGAESLYEVPVTQAVQQLLQTEAQLVERRDQQRRANRTQLEDMISSMDELVLIPP